MSGLDGRRFCGVRSLQLWLRVWGWVEIEATVRIWGVGSKVGDGDSQCLGIAVLSDHHREQGVPESLGWRRQGLKLSQSACSKAMCSGVLAGV